MLPLRAPLIGPGLGRLALYGALGALYGSGAMTLVRLGMRRAGLIDKPVPQAVEEWVSRQLESRNHRARAPAISQPTVTALGYGLIWGALAAPALFAQRRRRTDRDRSYPRLGTWAIGAAGLFPLLQIARPAWKSSAAENLSNIAARVIFGLAVQLLSEEAARQGHRGATTDATRHRARVDEPRIAQRIERSLWLLRRARAGTGVQHIDGDPCYQFWPTATSGDHQSLPGQVFAQPLLFICRQTA